MSSKSPKLSDYEKNNLIELKEEGQLIQNYVSKMTEMIVPVPMSVEEYKYQLKTYHEMILSCRNTQSRAVVAIGDVV